MQAARQIKNNWVLRTRLLRSISFLTQSEEMSEGGGLLASTLTQTAIHNSINTATISMTIEVLGMNCSFD
jgi:hypothetical protein